MLEIMSQAREAGGSGSLSRVTRFCESSCARSAGFKLINNHLSLGLTPQALCCRALRALMQAWAQLLRSSYQFIYRVFD
jgi:hypothetical protein